MNGTIGVAISTTADEHRLGFLETCVAAWRRALPLGSLLVVTVDGDEAAASRAREAVGEGYGTAWRVGQPSPFPDGIGFTHTLREGRLGVAANKNTGLEILMDWGAAHLFLCDDDTWPIFGASITKHIEFEYPHSMVCWGKSRLAGAHTRHRAYAWWTWPRGVLLYTHRSVVESVGGMDERFGPGGHEHVEWSRRIHQAGHTPEPFITPASYATRGGTGARALWHCEDMARPGEVLGSLRRRRKQITSVRRQEGDWERIERVMVERDGDTTYVPYRASENGRLSATIAQKPTSRGAGGEK